MLKCGKWRATKTKAPNGAVLCKIWEVLGGEESTADLGFTLEFEPEETNELVYFLLELKDLEPVAEIPISCPEIGEMDDAY